jgi:eukaryotic-like serine/threonine-protein kinase
MFVKRNYKKLGLLGEGANGKVYLVEDSDELQFALKEYALDGKIDDEIRIHYDAEKSLHEKVLSNNVVKLYDFWEEEGKLCLLFEYCEYGCLKHHMTEEGQFPLRKTLKVGICILNALSSLHKENIIHRDVKPHNILQARKGVLKLADMGLARIDGQSKAECPHGTVAYISPEQFLDYDNVDERSDIYSVGATLYHLYTGKEVYKGESLKDTLDSHQNCIVPNMRDLRPDCPLSFNHIFRKMIAKNPADRYQTADEAKRDLEKVLSGISTIHELPSIQDFKSQVDIGTSIGSIPNNEEQRQKKIIIATMLVSVIVVLVLILSNK